MSVQNLPGFLGDPRGQVVPESGGNSWGVLGKCRAGLSHLMRVGSTPRVSNGSLEARNSTGPPECREGPGASLLLRGTASAGMISFSHPNAGDEEEARFLIFRRSEEGVGDPRGTGDNALKTNSDSVTPHPCGNAGTACRNSELLRAAEALLGSPRMDSLKRRPAGTSGFQGFRFQGHDPSPPRSNAGPGSGSRVHQGVVNGCHAFLESRHKPLSGQGEQAGRASPSRDVLDPLKQQALRCHVSFSDLPRHLHCHRHCRAPLSFTYTK